MKFKILFTDWLKEENKQFIALTLFAVGYGSSMLLGISLLGDILLVNPDSIDWIQYVALGTLYPMTITIGIITWHLFKRLRSFLIGIFLVFLFAGLTTLVIFQLTQRWYLVMRYGLPGRSWFEFLVIMILSFIQILIAYLKYPNWFTKRNAGFVCVIFLLLLSVWSASIQIITYLYGFWDSGPSIEGWLLPINSSVLPISSAIRRVVLLLSISIAVTWYWFLSPRMIQQEKSHKTIKFTFGFDLFIDAVILVFIALICFSFDRQLLLDPWMQAHRATFIDPAQAVRNGAWLFWDQGSAYGFLDILSISAIRWLEVPAALTFLIMIANFCVSIILYFTFRSINPSLIGKILSFCVVTSTLLIRLYPNKDVNLDIEHPWFWLSPLVDARSGGFRNIWGILLLLLLYLYRFAHISFRSIEFTGNAIFTIGCFWSVESAIYSIATWIPAYIFIVFCMKKKGLHYFIPIICLITFFVMVNIYYYLNLAGLPSFESAFDILRYVAPGGSVGISLRRDGSIQGSIQVFWISIAIIVILIIKFSVSNLKNLNIPLLLGCFGLLWSSTSYYIGYTANPKFHVLMHVYAFCIAILIKLFHQTPHRGNILSMMPLPIIISLIVIGNDADMKGLQWLKNIIEVNRFSLLNVENHFASADEKLHAFLSTSGVKDNDPIIMANNAFRSMPRISNDLTVSAVPIAWLPYLHSNSLDHQMIYTKRYVLRVCKSGWLLEPKDNISMQFSSNNSINVEVLNLVNTHVAKEKYENENWRLTRYDILPFVCNNTPFSN